MSEEPTAAITRIPRAKLAWLESESAQWVDAGLLEPASRSRILSRYAAESTEHRSMLALTILGALMFAIGVLLLIAYNWSAIPAAGKVGLLMGSVAAAFAGSSAAAARRRATAADILALVGVLLFGNAIWLIAQVLHIEGDFPNGFLAWAAGAVATAALVRSRMLGIAGAALVTIWIAAAAIEWAGSGDLPFVPFVLLWPTAVALAYHCGSPTMIRILAVGGALWMAFWPASHTASVGVGSAAIAACAFYAYGFWHRTAEAIGRAWQSAGCSILLVTFVPLLVADFHDDAPSAIAWSAIVPAVVLAAGVLASAVRARRDRAQLADGAITGTATVIALWLILLARGWGGADSWERGVTVGFSMLSLVLAVALLRKALRTDRVSDLMFGVAFALAFLLVRWASLIDSMLWSGIMLLAASAGFFVIARLWRHRPRRQASNDIAAGGAS